jgi:hypothetical protein
LWPFREKAGGHYVVGFSLRLPARHCSGSEPLSAADFAEGFFRFSEMMDP